MICFLILLTLDWKKKSFNERTSLVLFFFIFYFFHFQMDNLVSVSVAEPVSNLLCSFLGEFIETQWTLTILCYLLLAANPSLWWEECEERRAELYLEWLNSKENHLKKEKKNHLSMSCPVVPVVWLFSSLFLLNSLIFHDSFIISLYLINSLYPILDENE